MAQAGIHGLVSVAIRKWLPASKGLMLGVVLGSLLPDADNLVVAVATVMKKSTEGIHRTATHSLITIVAIMAIFYIIGRLSKKQLWVGLGFGLGIGMLLHVLLDILIWFDGVAIFWPVSYYLNIWDKAVPPDWWKTLMNPLELGFIALFFLALDSMARKQNTDLKYLRTLRIWTIVEAGLFGIFLVLAYTMSKGFLTIFGAVYLLSLALAVGVSIRMRKTIETTAPAAVKQRAPSPAGD
jgi:membrane-bound metal-dependent hydrolase YbcI (DUF457 family)